MRIEPPALLPILRSQHQARLLTWLLLHPSQEYSLADLAKVLGIAPSTLHQEVARLVRSGIISDRKAGRNRLLRVNSSNRLVPALTELMSLSFGPQVVVAEEFSDLEGADLVIVYGSWAERYTGTEGPQPGDIDVMVVGGPDRGQVYDAADRAQERLGIHVNPTIRSAASWRTASDALVASIQAGAHVTVADQTIEGAA